jgi:hypothetical protein
MTAAPKTTGRFQAGATVSVDNPPGLTCSPPARPTASMAAGSATRTKAPAGRSPTTTFRMATGCSAPRCRRTTTTSPATSTTMSVAPEAAMQDSAATAAWRSATQDDRERAGLSPGCAHLRRRHRDRVQRRVVGGWELGLNHRELARPRSTPISSIDAARLPLEHCPRPRSPSAKAPPACGSSRQTRV